MFTSPAGGSGELFPSSAEGRVDEGLSGEQTSDAQTLITSALGAALSGYYLRGTGDTLLSGKQPTITEGSLSQSKIQTLTSDLAAKVSTQQLAEAIATREPTITEGSLSQSKVTNLVADLGAKALQADLVSGLAGKASSQQLADAIATRQPLLTSQSNIAVDTISSRLFLGDVFRFWKADQSSALLTISDNVLGAEFATTIRAPSLLLGSYCGIGTPTPQAALDVVGSILCSAGLQAGNIDIIERLLAHGTAIQQRHPLITPEAPLPQSQVQGLVDVLSAAATSAVIADNSLSIAKTNGLQDALNARVTTSALDNSLAYKQDNISTTYPLPRSHAQGLEAALSGKAPYGEERYTRR